MQLLVSFYFNCDNFLKYKQVTLKVLNTNISHLNCQRFARISIAVRSYQLNIKNIKAANSDLLSFQRHHASRGAFTLLAQPLK